MFEWFFGNKSVSHFSKVLIRCENLLKDIDATRKTYQILEEYSKEKGESRFSEKTQQKIQKQLNILQKRLHVDLIISKEVSNILSKLDKDLIALKEKVKKLEAFLVKNNILQELGNLHVVIQVLNTKFNSLKEFLGNIENLENIFDKLITEKTNIKSINAEYFKQEILFGVEYLSKNINLEELEKKYSTINAMELFLKEYVSVLKQIKAFLNKYWDEFQLTKKIVKNYKKGKRGAELIESVFGKSYAYNFNKVPNNESDIVNKLIYNMRKSMSEDEINRVMHRLRFRLVDKADFLTRGLSDKEAKIFASTISELAGPIGINLRKDNTVDGYGFLHAGGHFAEIIDVVNPKLSSLKSALEDTIKHPKFNISSRGSRFLCNPLKGGRYFLVAITNPSVGFITFYHMDDSSTQKGLLNSIKMMANSGDMKFFKHKTNNDHYLVLFSQNRASVYIIEYEKKDDGKVYINAKHIRQNELSSLLKDFVGGNNKREFIKFIEKSKKKQIIDLHALAA